MKSILKMSAVLTMTAMVYGCGATKVAVQPDRLATTHKIALIKVQEPDAYTGQDFGNPMIMFGAIGGAIAGGSAAGATKSLDQLAAEANFAAGDRFTKQLSEKLASQGYQVSVIEAQRAEKTKLLESYDSVDAAGADAVMDIAIASIGYATEHPILSPQWRPASQVHVALVDSRSKSAIYSDKFMFGYHNPFMSGTDVDASKEFFFSNKDELFADADKLVRGMEESVDAVVAQIVEKLKK